MNPQKSLFLRPKMASILHLGSFTY